jgi:hypothetical protein
MRRQHMQRHCDDEELHNMVGLLNGLIPELFPIRWTKARKEHEDLFGETISTGENYLTRKTGAAWGDSVKLSQLSVERVFLSIFDDNPGLRKLAHQVNEQRQERIHAEHARASPVDNWSL